MKQDKSSGSSSEGTLLDDVSDEGKTSVAQQIGKVEDLLKKLNLIKRERSQVFKDLKDKVPRWSPH